MELKIDAILPPGIAAAGREAVRFEALGFDGLWALETQSDPFQDLASPALRTTRPELGSNVAIAFARSPFLTALDAWRLQQASQGRFILGLGTEIKGHIERRFGMPWEAPGPKLREYVQAVRAIWRAFQGEERLNFRGRFYSHTLLIPYFDPGPIDYPAPPIYLAAVNPYNCETVGLVGDGIMIHPVHSVPYLEAVVLPAVDRGLRRAARSRGDIAVVCSVFVISGDEQERRQADAYVRTMVAFQGAVRTYAPIFETHGWGHLPHRLHELMSAGDVRAMAGLISDEMVEAFAVTGRNDEEIADKLRERYAGIADRVCIFNLSTCPFGGDDERLRQVVRRLRRSEVAVGGRPA